MLVERTADQLSGTLSRPPTAADIARKLELSGRRSPRPSPCVTYDALSLDRRPAMPTATRTSRCSTRWARKTATSSSPTANRSQGHASAAQARAEILRLRFVEDLTQTEIAECLGVSQMQVSRLLRRSLDRLRVVAEAAETAAAA